MIIQGFCDEQTTDKTMQLMRIADRGGAIGGVAWGYDVHRMREEISAESGHKRR